MFPQPVAGSSEFESKEPKTPTNSSQASASGTNARPTDDKASLVQSSAATSTTVPKTRYTTLKLPGIAVNQTNTAPAATQPNHTGLRAAASEFVPSSAIVGQMLSEQPDAAIPSGTQTHSAEPSSGNFDYSYVEDPFLGSQWVTCQGAYNDSALADSFHTGTTPSATHFNSMYTSANLSFPMQAQFQFAQQYPSSHIAHSNNFNPHHMSPEMTFGGNLQQHNYQSFDPGLQLVQAYGFSPMTHSSVAFNADNYNLPAGTNLTSGVMQQFHPQQVTQSVPTVAAPSRFGRGAPPHPLYHQPQQQQLQPHAGQQSAAATSNNVVPVMPSGQTFIYR